MDSNSEEIDALRKRLDDSCDIANMRKTEGWKIVEEVFTKIGEKAMKELAYVDIKDTVQVIELQQLAKMSKKIIQIVENLETTGDMAFELLKKSGNLNISK